MTQATSGGLASLVDAYCKVWSEPDPDRRRLQLASIWAPDATYTDPAVHTASSDELLEHISKVLTRRPGARVERTSHVDEHHGCARFAWHVVQADGSSLPEGIDFLEINGDGKIQRIVGFFGPVVRMDGQ